MAEVNPAPETIMPLPAERVRLPEAPGIYVLHGFEHPLYRGQVFRQGLQGLSRLPIFSFLPLCRKSPHILFGQFGENPIINQGHYC
jgi:hypothetical protein